MTGRGSLYWVRQVVYAVIATSVVGLVWVMLCMKARHDSDERSRASGVDDPSLAPLTGPK